jgi:signal transduction histidine kinase
MHELYQPAMQEQGLELVLSCDGEAVLTGKRQLLAQLIANLLENALKHARGGTRVEVSLQGDARAVTLAISDNGPGMQPGTPSGSGLGLNLVRAIAKLHRGEVALHDNSPGLRVECRFERPQQASA